MIRPTVCTALVFALLLTTCTTRRIPDDLFAFALNHKEDLQLSVFITTQAVNEFLSTEEGRREATSIMRANGITKAYLEVYRGEVASPELLKAASDYLKKEGFEVVGGIATVPGKDFGVRQAGSFEWFNWQNPKTQNDLRNVMESVAPIFDTFIVDDFMATWDTSEESTAAKGDRSWPEYRRDLLSGLSKSIFIDAVKKINPDINMIIKYPQWYDRYHVFGYDVVRQPQHFDQVWVGTETRGQDTESFGFVQSYESFITYRWLASLSGNKIGGAWFDHIDCDANDFMDQAYQSVLAGARELVIFNYYNLVEGHPGHHQLRLQFPKLIELSSAVAANPVHGVAGYKPPHSDGSGNLYVMDYIGMLGVPLIPHSSYPTDEKVIFLPAHAAADTGIYKKVEASLKTGARIIATSGFLASLPQRSDLARLAGVKADIKLNQAQATEVIVDGQLQKLKLPLALDATISLTDGTTLLEAVVGNQRIPYLTRSKEENVFILNAHTFSEEDFIALKELLLCPAPVGLVHLPREWANELRRAFNEPLGFSADASTRIVVQPFGKNEWMVHNYNNVESLVTLSAGDLNNPVNALNGEALTTADGRITFNMPPRGRIWIKSSGAN